MFTFDNLTPERAYLLGFITADGNCSRGCVIRIELQGRDEPILRSFFRMFQQEGYKPHLSISTKKGREYCALRVGNKPLVSYLATIGITGNKTYTVPFLESLPDNLLVDYTRGVWDGDGSVYIRKNSVVSEVCSASSGFILTLNKNLPRLGIPEHTIDTKTIGRRHPLYRITLWKYAPEFLQKVYYPNCLCLERKRNVFINFKKEPDRKITWFSEHDKFLSENQHLPIKELSQALSKTEDAVYMRLWRIKTGQLVV